jgi:dolichyl-phosphate beta-glucosyltransferase
VSVPINWYFDGDSRVNPIPDTYRMVRDVLRIRLNGRRGVYDRRQPEITPAGVAQSAEVE